MRRWRAEGFFSRARVDIRVVWQVVAAPWLFKREEYWTRWKNSEVEGKRRLVWTCSPHFAWLAPFTHLSRAAGHRKLNQPTTHPTTTSPKRRDITIRTSRSFLPETSSIFSLELW